MGTTTKTIDMLGANGVSIDVGDDDCTVEFTPEGVTVTITRDDQKMVCGIRHEDNRWRFYKTSEFDGGQSIWRGVT